jgi:spore germination protein
MFICGCFNCEEGEEEMKKRLGLCILSLIIVTGCVEKEILDDINIEIARGYDWEDEDTTKGTMLIYNFQPDKSIENTTLTTTASTSRELVNKLQEQASNPLSEGSLEVVLIGKELANKGFIDYLDAPLRNASIGARLFVVAVDGNANDLLSGSYGTRGNAIFISNLLNHNIENQNLPKTNLQLFFHDYYQLGKSVYIPQIKKLSDDTLGITGISLLKTEKLIVVDTIEPEKMFFFKLLVDKFSEGSHKVQREEDEVIVRSITSRHKMKVTKRNPYSVTVHIKIRGVTREYTGPGKLDEKVISQYEKAMEELVEKECDALIKRFQEKGIDPVGFGHFIKSRTRGFKLDKGWEESDQYKNLTVNVKADVKIVESGVIE